MLCRQKDCPLERLCFPGSRRDTTWCVKCDRKWVESGAKMEDLVQPQFEDNLLDLRAAIIAQGYADYSNSIANIYSDIWVEKFDHIWDFRGDSKNYYLKMASARQWVSIIRDMRDELSAPNSLMLTGLHQSITADQVLTIWNKRVEDEIENFDVNRFRAHHHMIVEELAWCKDNKALKRAKNALKHKYTKTNKAEGEAKVRDIADMMHDRDVRMAKYWRNYKKRTAK